jgi:hypothetical protein
MGIDTWKTREILENTEFAYLIKDFEASGYNNFRMFKPLVYNGELLRFLNDFENDNEKKKKLSGLITAKVKEGNKFIESMIKPLSIGFIILVTLFLIYIFK